MFYFLTGKPGASKTLNAIELVEQLREQSRKSRGVERPVYYWNIGDVTLEGWNPLGDPVTFDLRNEGVEPDLSVVQKWFTMPRDSIIVLDECQILWRKRAQGAPVPDCVSMLETHRKSGFDIVATSQDPTLVDSHARKLVGEHRHYRRIFGTENYHTWTWHQRCVTDPESTSEQAKALEKRGRFAKRYYGTYRSAQVHNVQARHPVKWYAALAAAAVLVPLLVWLGIRVVSPEEARPEPSELRAVLQEERAQTVKEVAETVQAIMASNPWDSRLHAARVRGIEASKPLYDSMIEPVAVPRIVGCMMLEIDGRVTCECHSQQGTVIDMPPRNCRRIIERGYFDFLRPDEAEPSREEDQQSTSAGSSDLLSIAGNGVGGST